MRTDNGKTVFTHPVGCVRIVKVDDGFFTELYGIRMSAHYGENALENAKEEANSIAKEIRK